MYADLLVLGFLGWLLLMASVVFKAVWVFFQQRRNYKMLEAYEGPEGAWPWGTVRIQAQQGRRMTEFYNDGLLKYTSSEDPCMKMLGPVFFNSLNGSSNDLVTKDPVVVKYVLQDNFENFRKTNRSGNSNLLGAREWLGHGIFVIDHGKHAQYPSDGGKLWFTQRRTASAIFTKNLFQSYYRDVFIQHGRKLLDRLEKESEGGLKVVDLQYWLHACTMDAIGQIAFGYPLGTVDGTDATFGTSFDTSQSSLLTFTKSNVKPLLLTELLPEPLRSTAQRVLQRLSPTWAEFEASCAVTNRHIADILKRKKQEDITGKSDLLSLFMKATDDDGRPMFSDELLRDVCISFLVAGRDTTAGAVSWLMYELAQHPKVLKAVQEEIDSVTQGEDPTLEMVSDMPYLRGAVWETLRLHPLPMIAVTAAHDDVLPGGQPVPAGTRILISTHAMGRDTARWGEDALVFKPERWIPFEQPSPFEFPAFKAGRRTCLGRDMALFESTTLAVQLLQKLTPELAATKLTRSSKLTSCVHNAETGKDELPVRLHKRE